MGKLRRNFLAGIRKPSTFASDVVWEHTPAGLLVIRVDRLVRRDYQLYPWDNLNSPIHPHIVGACPCGALGAGLLAILTSLGHG
jgi:hypothetical protein